MENQDKNGLSGQAKMADIDDLLLDPDNPRFPATGETDQAAIAKIVADNYDALEIARKIAAEGFHVAEPPAVIHHDGKYLVVEGNRRTTAVKGLLYPELRATFANAAEWDKAAAAARREPSRTLPVAVYPTKKAARSLISHRHIKGILQWDPPEQAKWVQVLIDDDKETFATAADLCSKRLGEVRDMYRNSRLIHHDLPALGIDPSRIEARFTVFGNVLANKTLREYAGVKSSSEVGAGDSTLVDPQGANEELKELVRWVAGTATEKPLLDDSRRIVKLGQVVAVPEGREALHSGKNLDEALQIVSELGADPHKSAVNRLKAAANATASAVQQIENLDEDDDRAEIEHLLRHIRKSLTRAEGALHGEVED